MDAQPTDPPRKQRLRVASVQAVAVPGEIERNVEAARRLIDEAAAAAAALIVFPELFLCCYDLALLRRDPARCDIQVDDPRLEPIRKACRVGAITAVISGSVPKGDSRTLSALVIDDHGRLSARYDKQHLWHDERPIFMPGTGPGSVDVHGWQLGLGICYDVSFPEHARAAALAGADGYLCPSADREPPAAHPERARENSMYVVFSNLVGEADRRRFCGQSSIYDPRGERLADAGPVAEGLAIADFDPAVVTEVREQKVETGRLGPAS